MLQNHPLRDNFERPRGSVNLDSLNFVVIYRRWMNFLQSILYSLGQGQARGYGHITQQYLIFGRTTGGQGDENISPRKLSRSA